MSTPREQYEESNLSRIPSPPPWDRGGRDRGGWNEGAAWNRRPARRDMDIVDKELNRYQPAFDHVQRYPEGYGGQPTRGGRGFGGRRGGGRRGGDGWLADDNKFDRFIGAIEGIAGKGGGNVTNTFNPTFNPTNVNAGRDIRDTSIIGGGPNTAGRDITGAGGDVETGDYGGGNTVTGPGGTVNQPIDTTPDDTTPDDTTPDDTTPDDTTPDDTNKYDAFIHSTYNDLLGRDAGQEGLDYWSKDLEGGQTEQQVIDNIKRSDEYLNRQQGINLAGSMEGKVYDKDKDTSLGNINEASLDAWVGPGGALTQSSDADAAGYYEGVGDKEKASILLNSFSRDLPDGMVGLPAFSPLDDRQEAIYDMYTNVFGRNPDKEGLEYWTGAGGEGMSLADIEASFRGSAEAKLRDNVSGTDTPIYQSVDDYLAGKTNMLSNPPAATDGVAMGSNNASTGQSAPESLAGTASGFNASGPLASLASPNKEVPIVDDGWRTDFPRSYGKPEIEERVALMYKDLLGREADQEGLEYWTQEILNNPSNIVGPGGMAGPQHYKDAINAAQDNIMRSDEYQKRKNRTSPPFPGRLDPIPGRGDGRAPKPLPKPPIIGDPGPREPEIRRPKPSIPPRMPGLTPIMPTPSPVTPIDPPSPKPPNATDWLQKAYTQAGLGKVDAGGRDYWMGDLSKGQSKADVIANIMRHKK